MTEVRGARIEVPLVLALVALAACAPKHASVNHPPTVRAHCDPCAVAPGATAQLSAQAEDADGDRLNYRWTVAAGTVSNRGEVGVESYVGDDENHAGGGR